jgi:hypothetical protein
MATELRTDADSSATSLVTGILHDSQELFKQQMALFKVEVKSDLHKTIQATTLLVAGALVAFVGAILLCFTAAHGLTAAFPALPLWGSFAIVTAVVLAGGAALLLGGRQKFKSFNPLPDESVAALQENLEWTTKPR